MTFDVLQEIGTLHVFHAFGPDQLCFTVVAVDDDIARCRLGHEILVQTAEIDRCDTVESSIH